MSPIDMERRLSILLRRSRSPIDATLDGRAPKLMHGDIFQCKTEEILRSDFTRRDFRSPCRCEPDVNVVIDSVH